VRVRGIGAVASGAAVGFALGAVLSLSLQGVAVTPRGGGSVSHATAPFTVPEAPDTFLAWIPGGFPAGFRESLAAAPGFEHTVVVASDNTWLTRSFDAQGQTVDDPPSGFSIPLEVGAVNPREFAPFLPPADRGVVLALAAGQGVLGESSAKLRGLGPGAVLRFGDVDVTVAAILPDELVGAHELFVSLDTGRRIGVTHDRYALLQPQGRPTDRQLEKQIRALLPAGTLVRVRAPGETPFFRQGDAVLPPVRLKMLFGEFAAKPTPGQPGYLTLDPAWVRTHIATEHVPLLGNVTCNVALFPQIRGAIHELIDEGLADTITSFSGCYSHRFVNRDPEAGISHHTWGAALDINVPQNPFGAVPHQDPRMVAVFERWGFIWGGTFILPDGMHFEYRRPPASS
jgi:hypothetical protein